VTLIGTVESLWRYPVKSMRGEALDELFAGYSGVYGDRLFAFTTSAGRDAFPWFTGRDKPKMICYRARFRHPARAAHPANYIAAQDLAPGANPMPGTVEDLMVDVETPDGQCFAINDPRLAEHLRAGADPKHQLTLLRSDKAMADCRPLSIFAIQTAGKLEKETGMPVDKRSFRANIYVDLVGTEGFAENQLVGKPLRIGSKLVVAVLERDPRCMMITLDPETAEKRPAVLKAVAQAHEGEAGIYAAVLREGIIRKGDRVELLDA
jgi:uncharacterized protein YcbX